MLPPNRTLLLVDSPTRDVPDALARAGHAVIVAGGPDTYETFELVGRRVTTRRTAAPTHVDFVYCYRPLVDLPELVAQAARLGASALWWEHPGASAADIQQAQALATAAGLKFYDWRAS